MKKSNKKNEKTTNKINEENLEEPFLMSPNYSAIRRAINRYQANLLLYYYDMSYIASIADNCYVLAKPFQAFTKSGIFPPKRREQFENDLIVVEENNKKARKVYIKLEKHLKLKSTIFDFIRQIYPNFCLNLENKIDATQLDFYKKIRRNLRSAVYFDSPYLIDTPSSEVLNNLRDNLSKVIDSKSFIDACIIEDNFLLSEFNEFSTLLANLSPEERNAFLGQKVKLSDSKTCSTQELLNKFNAEISSNLSRHLETLKLYDRISSAEEIKLILKSEDHDDESCGR